MSNNFLKILYSVVITVIVSTLFATLFNNNFWTVFVLATILQFLLFYIFNKIYTNRLIYNLEVIKERQLKEVNRNYTNVVCPCNKKSVQFIDLRFDVDTVYKCNDCENSIKCVPNPQTFVVTSPIYFKNT